MSGTTPTRGSDRREPGQCPKCGYMLGPFDSQSPRCAWMAAQACQVCGRKGIVGRCAMCGKDVCKSCRVRDGSQEYCAACAPTSLAAAARAAEGPHAEGASEPIRQAPSAELGTGQGRPRLPGPGFVQAVSRPAYSRLWVNLRRAGIFMRESLAMAFRDKGYAPAAYYLGLRLHGLSRGGYPDPASDGAPAQSTRR